MSEVLFDFNEKKPERAKPKPKPKHHTTGGRGKKQCRNNDCGVFVGVRNRCCPVCNTSFEKKETVSRANVEPTIESVETNVVPKIVVNTTKEYNSIVVAPSGKCPIMFDCENITADTIIKWAESVREWGLKDKKYLTAQAITYYARYSVDSLSSEYTLIRDTIAKWEADGIR